ncbi:hypothetical protein B566_EDAN014484 [Ephemera danica]|nr:hypothetical protein B566_EDAN014484 [Ephemera danica]
MKSLCLIVVVAAFFTAALAAPKELTAEEVATLQIDRILGDEQLVKGYFECVMDKGPCDPAGEALKSLLPKWFDSECSTCNERQKENISKIVKFAKDNKAELYEQIEKKFKSLEA